MAYLTPRIDIQLIEVCVCGEIDVKIYFNEIFNLSYQELHKA